MQRIGTPDTLKRGCSSLDTPTRGFGTPKEVKQGSGRPGKQKEVMFCPIEKHANAILRSGKQMVSAMHRLRRNLCKCRRCPAFGVCEFRENFNQLIDAVILEINEEWGLL
jgi:hypothetical protein